MVFDYSTCFLKSFYLSFIFLFIYLLTVPKYIQNIVKYPKPLNLYFVFGEVFFLLLKTGEFD